MTEEKPKQTRGKAKRFTFTELSLARLKAPKVGQRLYWDTGTKGQLGLSVLVSAGGTKSYRATFVLNDKHVSDRIGRVGELDLTVAREKTLHYRKMAADGIDPREPKKGKKILYEDVVDQFVEHYAKPRQRTWDQTQRALKNTCAPFVGRPFNKISKQDAYRLLDGFKADGHDYKAAVTLRWLKTLWKWARKREFVETSIMEDVDIDFERRERDRVYSADEIKRTWAAAEKLPPISRDYIKLLILLAPRKTALACMRRSHLDDPDNPTIWVTPFELTKSRKTTDPKKKKKREYRTPLPLLAQRIIKGIATKDDDDRLFATLPVHQTKAGRPTFFGVHLKQQLVEHGAPKDFGYHTWRHTIATFLENAGHDEWSRGLVLNHSGTGVTAGYSHGHPLELKRKLLEQWADHVEGLTTPAGVKRLR